MCGGNIKVNPNPDADSPQDSDSDTDYSHIFTELEAQMIAHRAMMMRRLVLDPFYITMNISDPCRHWMLRHLATLAEQAELRYNITLLQFFELMDREEVLEYLRYKNAPSEMIELWRLRYPSVTDDNNPEPAPNGGDGKPTA